MKRPLLALADWAGRFGQASWLALAGVSALAAALDVVPNTSTTQLLSVLNRLGFGSEALWTGWFLVGACCRWLTNRAASSRECAHASQAVWFIQRMCEQLKVTRLKVARLKVARLKGGSERRTSRSTQRDGASASTARSPVHHLPPRNTWSGLVWYSKVAGRVLVPLALLVGTKLAWASTERESPYHVIDQMSRVLVLIENEYVEPVERARLLEGGIKGMVAELDPHSSYLPARDYTIFQGDTEGRFGGIGVEVDFARDQVVVIAPIEGSPADRAGVKPGDKIVSIDGQPVRAKSPETLVRQMRGKPGTTVVVTVKRPPEDKLIDFELTREVIKVSSIASKLLEGDVLYLRIKSFQTGTHHELLSEVAKLRSKVKRGFSGMILDLRNNPGGLVNEASAVADEFLTGGVIYTTRHRNQVVREARARRSGALRRGSMVVLVNEFSASAAELVAGALQDNYRASLVGSPTFGKGSVQTIIELPSRSGLKLTTALYYTPGGHAIQAAGVKPDVLVEAAYVADSSYDIVRESDLEGHLPASGAEAGPAADEAADPGSVDADDANQQTHLGVLREIPENPAGSADFALSIGYQIVTGVMNRRP